MKRGIKYSVTFHSVLLGSIVNGEKLGETVACKDVSSTALAEMRRNGGFIHFDDTSEPPTETVRKYFPETWIWDLVVVR